MLDMAESSRAFCEQFAPEIFQFDEVNDALAVISDLIDEKGFAPPHYYDYNDFGREAQRVYDDLYLSNGGVPMSGLDDLKKKM